MFTPTTPRPGTTDELELVTVRGQPSYRLATDRAQAYVTALGGHIGPVSFELSGRGEAVSPMSVVPWAEEVVSQEIPVILRVLRGDPFCLPFGGNDTPWRGEHHPIHGEVANGVWQPVSLVREGDAVELTLAMETAIRPGRVSKTLRLVDGQSVLYQRHVIRDMHGPMCVGHHPMLDCGEREGGEGSVAISVSPFVDGRVNPDVFERPEKGGRSALQPGATFEALDAVPLAAGGMTDLSRYPARGGHEDLVQLWTDPSLDLGWTAAVFRDRGMVYFQLKDPRVLGSTVLWLSNGGRDYEPWNGRHVGVIGLEETVSYFAYGLAASAEENDASRAGHRTAVDLDPARPLTVNFILGVAAAPPSFDRVASLDRTAEGIRLTADSGDEVDVTLDVDWLFAGAFLAADERG